MELNPIAVSHGERVHAWGGRHRRPRGPVPKRGRRRTAAAPAREVPVTGGSGPDVAVPPGLRLALAGRPCVIGRSPDCDVRVDDPRVSARHARVEPLPGGAWRVLDLGSRNGTFRHGERFESLEVRGGTHLRLGHPDRGVLLELVAGRPQRPAIGRGATCRPGVELEDVVVRRGGAELLHGIRATLPAGKLSVVIGPSGAGKSTLLAALTGDVPLARGRVLLHGADLAELDAGTIGSLIGVVPQDDVLHASLPLRASLRTSARLLMPSTASREERHAAVERVLGQLHLTAHGDQRIDRLSGGQRKRANAAAALLTRPGLLVLDEPTSGLDPHLERSYMRDLKELADSGTTVVVVTHSPAAVDVADHVLAVTAGRIAYEGAPSGLPGHFRARGLGTVFAELGDASEQWADRWEQARRASGTRRLTVAPTVTSHGPRRHQLLPLLGRNLRLLAADRGSLALLLVQAPVLGLLARLFPDGGGFDPATAPNADIRTMLLVLVLAATWLGTFAAIRQVVDERRVLDRELAAGVSPLAYVVARVILLALLALVQVSGLFVPAMAGRHLPAGQLLDRPGLEVLVTLVLAGWTASVIALLASALARSGAGAAALAPLVVVPQLLLCGALVRVDDMVALDLAARLVSARAAFSAAAASTDLPTLEGGTQAPAAWEGDALTWSLGLLELGGLASVALLALWWVLHRRAAVRP
ncbi:ATP-binding cassette domain-containing protein [Geodermatophilus sp. SYSU D00758]